MAAMRFSPVILSVLSLLVVACEKSSSPTGGAQPTQEPSAASGASGSASVATAPASALDPSLAARETEGGSSVAAAARGTAAGDASGPTADRDRVAAGTADGGAGAAALKPVSKHIAGNNFTLDLASPGCKAGSECTMTVKLVATADYHVNKEYPYKFTATPAPGVEFLGKPDAPVFTRAAGDFTEQGEKSGTMTIRFKPTTPGHPTIAGTYKFSVCSADQCQIEQEKLELTVPTL